MTDFHQKRFQTLGLGLWQSICMTAALEKSIKVYLDSALVVDISEYKGLLFNSSRNIAFLGGGDMDTTTTKKNLKITGVNMWNGTKSGEFIERWSKCKISKDDGSFKLQQTIARIDNVIEITDEDQSQCFQTLEKSIVGSSVKRNLDDTIEMCTILGGNIAVATDKTVLSDMLEVSNNLGTCKDGFFIGFSDREEEGDWVDVVHGNNMTFLNCFSGFYHYNLSMVISHYFMATNC